MPCGDTSEKWSSCYNKLTRPPRSSDGDVLTPHYQRFLPSLVLVSTANTLSLAADNKKKKVTSHCAWQQSGSHARIATARNPGRPHRVALVIPVRCVDSYFSLHLCLCPDSLSQKLFQFLKWLLRQIEADFCFLFFFSFPTLPYNLSGLIWEAVLLIFAVLRSCCSHQWNSPLIWPPKRKLLIWTMKTQIGINSQKTLRIFLRLISPQPDPDKKSSLIATHRHFSFTCTCEKTSCFHQHLWKKKNANSALIRAVMHVQHSEDCGDGSATLSFYINLQCICQWK